jgi:hypothetical protein
MAERKDNGFPVWAQPAKPCFVSRAYSHCPNCNSTYLTKVSLAYQKGVSSTVAYTRLRAVSVGGPDFVIGKATTRALHQSVLSQQLSPPVKWSYRKLILWWALMFLSIGWLICYISSITKNSAAVLSPPLMLFSLLSAATFLLLLILFWRHNEFTYKRRYRQWDRSFFCQRCGTLTR